MKLCRLLNTTRDAFQRLWYDVLVLEYFLFNTPDDFADNPEIEKILLSHSIFERRVEEWIGDEMRRGREEQSSVDEMSWEEKRKKKENKERKVKKTY